MTDELAPQVPAGSDKAAPGGEIDARPPPAHNANDLRRAQRKEATRRKVVEMVQAGRKDEGDPAPPPPTPPAAKPPETKTPPTTGSDTKEAPKTEREEKQAARWAAIAQAEQKIARDRSAAKAEVQRLKSEHEVERAKWQESVAPQQKELEALKAIREGRALEGLGALGVDYNRLTADVVAGRSPATAPADIEALVKAQVAPVLEELQSYRRAEEERRQTEAQTRVRAESVAMAKRELDADEGDRWELLRAEPDAAEQIYRYLEIQWDRAGRPVNDRGQPAATLTVEAAADKIEEFLVGQAERFLASTKIRGKFAGGPKTEGPGESTRETLGKRASNGAPPTLTNRDASAPTRRRSGGDREERKQRARALVRKMRTEAHEE